MYKHMRSAGDGLGVHRMNVPFVTGEISAAGDFPATLKGQSAGSASPASLGIICSEIRTSEFKNVR